MAESTVPPRSRPHEHEHDQEHVHEHDAAREGADDDRYGRRAAVTGGRMPALGLRDHVRWGPIWAGFITAVTAFLILTAAALAIGLQVVNPATGDVEGAGMVSAIVSAVIALLAFFIGGFVAGWAIGGIGRGYGALNGFLVWGLGMGILLVLTAFGLGSIFGASGELISQFQQLQSFQLQGVEASGLVDAMRNTALGALIGMLLPAASAAVGGMVGGLTSPDPVEA